MGYSMENPEEIYNYFDTVIEIIWGKQITITNLYLHITAYYESKMFQFYFSSISSMGNSFRNKYFCIESLILEQYKHIN